MGDIVQQNKGHLGLFTFTVLIYPLNYCFFSFQIKLVCLYVVAEK